MIFFKPDPRLTQSHVNASDYDRNYTYLIVSRSFLPMRIEIKASSFYLWKFCTKCIGVHSCWKKAFTLWRFRACFMPFDDNSSFASSGLYNHSQCLHGCVNTDNVKTSPLLSEQRWKYLVLSTIILNCGVSSCKHRCDSHHNNNKSMFAIASKWPDSDFKTGVLASCDESAGVI